MSSYPVVLGVYSHRVSTDMGTGATKSQRTEETYWFIRQVGPEKFDIQPLNIYHVPSGLREFISWDKLSEYTPEPKYYQVNTVPALKTLYDKVAKGQGNLKAGDLDSAEKEFMKALMIDDQNVEANYGLGEVYTEKNEVEKLEKILKVLMGLDEAFDIEHRAKLNSFGVQLRKNGHFEQAIVFMEKALKINPDDDHIHFNLARVYFDKKDFTICKRLLTDALRLNPNFSEAKSFLSYCNKMSPASS